MYTIFGIPNCDTVKKTLNWFKKANIPYRFYDYKKSGITEEQLKAWSSQVGFEKLLNLKSTTWRGLPEAEQALTAEERGAMQLMTSHTSLIKRPLIEKDGKVLFLGFDAKAYESLLK